MSLAKAGLTRTLLKLGFPRIPGFLLGRLPSGIEG